MKIYTVYMRIQTEGGATTTHPVASYTDKADALADGTERESDIHAVLECELYARTPSGEMVGTGVVAGLLLAKCGIAGVNHVVREEEVRQARKLELLQ